MSASQHNSIDFRRFLRQAKKSKWIYWTSAAVFAALTATYLYISMPLYVINGAMVIEDSTEESTPAGGISSTAALLMKSFSIGGFGASSINNEVHLAGSHDVMMRTARALELNRIYSTRTGGQRQLLFGDSPVRLEAPAEFFDTLSSAFKVKVNLHGNGQADIDITTGLLRHTIASVQDAMLPATVDTPFGPLTFAENPSATADRPAIRHLTIDVCGNMAAADRLYKSVTVEVDDKMSDIVEISMKYPSRAMGSAIVNMLMEQYIDKRSEQRKNTASRTIEYYNERIAAVADELAQSEKLSADYRKEHNISAVETQAKIMATAQIEGTMENVKARSEIDYYNRVLETVDGRLGRNALIPSVESFRDTSVAIYNSLIAQRADLEKSARPGNPALEKIDRRIALVSTNIKDNAARIIEKAKNDLNVNRQIVGSVNSKLSQYPEIEREYTALLRDRQFKNQLYLFLLQNRENAVLKLYSNSNPAYIYEPAYTELKPSKLKPLLVIILAIFGALAIPTLYVVWRNRRDDLIHDPMDLSSMGLENKCLTIDGIQPNFNRIRAMLSENPQRKDIYLVQPDRNGSTDSRLASELEDSFANAGINFAVNSTATSNSDLLKTAPTAGAYNLFLVPDCYELPEIAPALDSPSATILVAFRSGAITRRRLKKILSGRIRDNIRIVLFRQ